MRIRINGKERDLAEGATVGDVVDGITKDRSRIAVERNKEIVRRDTLDATPLQDGDVVEVVTLVGGG